MFSPTLSPINAGCTRSLNPAIAEQRIRHAAERIDFHSFFPFMTVAEIQRILRDEAPREESVDPHAERKGLIVDLLVAQQARPHKLWTLLLLVAFERELVQRRRPLSALPDVALDHLVVETLVASLENIPYSVDPDELRPHVLRAWGRRLKKAMRGRPLPRAALVTEPPPSAVVCSTADDDESTEVA